MLSGNNFSELLKKQVSNIGKVVDFDPNTDKLLPLNFTASNTDLTDSMLLDTDLFSVYIESILTKYEARYGIGGYNEHRTIYNRSAHFNTVDDAEPRRLHLGTDIWGPVGTPVYSFADAHIFGFANNNNFGDYGATIILKYNLNDLEFYGLYGHLSNASLIGLKEGAFIAKGEKFAEFGPKEENGHWPPHLHFQLMLDMQGNKTDYPGVCKFSEREKYLKNCPDPMEILKHSLS